MNQSLKRLKERKDYYTAEKIEDILKRYEQEQILRVKLNSDNARLAELTAHFKDITAKYKALCQEINNVLENIVRHRLHASSLSDRKSSQQTNVCSPNTQSNERT